MDLEGAGTGQNPTVIPEDLPGRYVRVQLGGTNYLSLAEVRVFAARVSAPQGDGNGLTCFGARTTAC